MFAILAEKTTRPRAGTVLFAGWQRVSFASMLFCASHVSCVLWDTAVCASLPFVKLSSNHLRNHFFVARLGEKHAPHDKLTAVVISPPSSLLLFLFARGDMYNTFFLSCVCCRFQMNELQARDLRAWCPLMHAAWSGSAEVFRAVVVAIEDNLGRDQVRKPGKPVGANYMRPCTGITTTAVKITFLLLACWGFRLLQH